MGNGSKYDPAAFNVPPSTAKGESYQLRVNVQAGHRRALQIIARSGVFPFGTDQDVARWCIKYGLERLNDLEPHLINSVLRRANMQLILLRDEIDRAKHVEWTETFRTCVQGLINRGDKDEARDMVQQCYRECLAMPDEPDRELRWKMRYLAVIETNFKELLG